MIKMKGMCAVHKLAAALVLIGALNWGLVGAFRFNLVTSLLGGWPTIERLVYVLVGISAIAMFGVCKCCMKGCGCGEASCDHCGPEAKKPMMGGEQKM